MLLIQIIYYNKILKVEYKVVDLYLNVYLDINLQLVVRVLSNLSKVDWLDRPRRQISTKTLDMSLNQILNILD